ncbi:hypothetical protein ACTEV3_002230 [Cronobacter malonaticus]
MSGKKENKDWVKLAQTPGKKVTCSVLLAGALYVIGGLLKIKYGKWRFD